MTDKIYIDDVKYLVEDMTDEQKLMLSHVQELAMKAEKAEREKIQAQVAQKIFSENLKASLTAKPEEVTEEEVDEV